MIQGFSDTSTQLIWNGEVPKGMPAQLAAKVLKRLGYLNQATKLTDLFKPPSNGFHSLGGKLDGWFAIKADDKWRIIFRCSEPVLRMCA